MGRRLPDAITRTAGETDEEYAARFATSKRRLQLFKRIYQNYYHWQSLRESGEVGDVITIEGEEIYIGDLLVGRETLPRRQRQAFELICMRGYTENAATAVLLPNSNWSTPVQQYSDDGLKKMVAAYDEKQAGTWDPEAAKKKRRTPTRKKEPVTTTAPPEVPEDLIDLNQTPTVRPTRNWDFTTWSDDHKSLADYITAQGVKITPRQVKAVAFLRTPWYKDPAQVAEREARKAARAAERDKFASMSPEQRQKRRAANQALKSAELLAEKLKKQQDRVRQLRTEAGLDPETGEPVASS